MLPSTARIGTVSNSAHEQPAADPRSVSSLAPTAQRLGQFAALPSRGQSAEEPKVSVLGFASDLTLDNGRKELTDPVIDRMFGRIGYSFDGGRTIFAFSYCVPQNGGLSKAAYRLMQGRTLPGVVTDDTDTFRSVSLQPNLAGSDAQEPEPQPQIVYSQDIPLSPAQIDAVKSAHEARPVGKPMPDIRYGLPFPGTTAFNGATYLSTLGIPFPHIPFSGGALDEYVQTLAENGKAWRPGEPT
ncbi:hypothetical protein LJR230_004651 [Trinickia sp. LjRoot230]|uniref:hypothetical protein n=1 Tax=Trinickia sp. LjRoot230 TaxID=3342288 RepID=UPI003ED0B2C6